MSGSHDLFDARLADRIARLRQELTDEDVPILNADALPEGLAPDLVEAFQALILEECVYARYVPVHEGLRPSYGCLIVQDNAPAIDSLETYRPAERTVATGAAGRVDTPGPSVELADPAKGSDPAPLSTAREPSVELHTIRPLVDGQATILVRDLNGAVCLATLDLSEELGALDVTRAHGATTVQRLPNGRIRIVSRRHVAVSDGHDWSVRPHAGSVVNTLTSELSLPGDRVARMREIGSLLEFCFHSLSPAGIGATLVVALAGTAHDLLSGVSDAGTQPAVDLNVFDRPDQGLLRNILAAVDGACLIDPDGSLRRYQTKLASSQDTSALVAEHGGTRHTSAKRFSFEHPDVLIIVVSADGPVTLFCAGVVVASLPAGTSPGTWIRSATQQLRARVQQTQRQDQCGRCHTGLMTKLTIDPEDDAATTITCVVCGQEVAEVVGVLESATRVRRTWE